MGSAPEPEPPAGPDSTESDLERRIKLISGVLAPTTVLTALLFYYGYVATAAEYAYFGVSMGSLGLSTQDFLLKSVAALYVPLGLLLLLVLLAAWGHAFLQRRLRSRRTDRSWRIGATVVMVGGTLVFARGVAGVVFPSIARSEAIATTPLCLGLGIGAIAYGRHLLRTVSGSPPDLARHWTETVGLAGVMGLIVLSVFWAANSFAAAYGTGRAERVADRLANRPAVVVDTTERLYADYACLEELELPHARGQEFRYRYLGLRLLAESGGRLFLLPEGWTPDSGAVLVVPVDAHVRMQFYRDASVDGSCRA